MHDDATFIISLGCSYAILVWNEIRKIIKTVFVHGVNKASGKIDSNKGV